MSDKQYLKAVQNLIDDVRIYMLDQNETDTDTYDNWYFTKRETERRFENLKAQEDNIKSEMWKEKNPMVFDASIMKWRERTAADDKHGKDVLKEFGL